MMKTKKAKDQTLNFFAGAFMKLRKNFYSEYTNPSRWIEKLAPRSAMIVQIGSNDGFQADPLYHLLNKHKDWRALFVEPVPYLFERLRRNYKNNEHYRFVRTAVNDGEKRTLYWVDPAARQKKEDLPDWVTLLGSFSREHILKHLGGILEPYIRETEVQGTRLPDLLSDQRIKKIDILHIDTEGWDWKVLSQLDFSRYEPAVILYEDFHLDAKEKMASYDFLKKRYHLLRFGLDILAVSRKKGKSLWLQRQLFRKQWVSSC